MSSPDREEETKQREEEAEEEMAVFNQMRIIAPISPKVGVRPRVINSVAATEPSSSSVSQHIPLTNLIMSLNCKASVEGPSYNTL